MKSQLLQYLMNIIIQIFINTQIFTNTDHTVIIITMESISRYWTFAIPLIIILGVLFIYRQAKKSKGPTSLQVKLVEKIRVSHDTYLYTFLLPNQSQPLGLKIGEHVETSANINGELVERKYTPVSQINKIGSFDLLIKVYDKCEKFPEGGKMSLYINSLKINDTLTIKYPYGRFNYQGNGNIRIRNIGVNATFRNFKVERLYMIAGGTGITPIYQIIQYIIAHPEDKTELVLLFLNRTQEDLLLTNELDSAAKQNPRLKVYYSVDRITTQYWTGFSGFLDKKKVQQTMFNKTTGLLCLSCGPPILSNIAENIWRDMGIKNQQMFRF